MLKRMFGMLTGGDRKDLATGELLTQADLQSAGHRLYETPDSTPMAPPIGYKREPSIMEHIRGVMLKEKVERLRQELGAETAEEAEDFDVPDPDEFEPSSEWEYDRHDAELLMAYEKLQNHRLAMDEKYGTTTADRNLDAAAKKAAEKQNPQVGGAGAPAPAEAAGGPPEAP